MIGGLEGWLGAAGINAPIEIRCQIRPNPESPSQKPTRLHIVPIHLTSS
jgi:hypothetical protein